MLRNSNKSVGTTSRKNQNAERLWLLRVRSDSRTPVSKSEASTILRVRAGSVCSLESAERDLVGSKRKHERSSASTFLAVKFIEFDLANAEPHVSRLYRLFGCKQKHLQDELNCLCLDHFHCGTYPVPNTMYSAPCAPVTVFACGSSLPVATEYVQRCLTPVEQRSDTFSHRTPTCSSLPGQDSPPRSEPLGAAPHARKYEGKCH